MAITDARLPRSTMNQLAGGGNAMDPLTIMMLLQGIGQGIQAGGAAAGAGKKTKQQMEHDLQMQREQQAASYAQNQMNTASDESKLDPFRHQMNQADDMSRLDIMGNASLTPAKVTPPARYAGSMPNISGGFSYSPTPGFQSDARALQQNVRAGNTAPSMTNPANFGKTGAVDLTQVDRGANPASPQVTAGGPGVPAGGMTPPVPAGLADPTKGVSGLDVMTRTQMRGNQIREFEAQHPGWTIDRVTGRVVPAAAVAPRVA